VNTPLAEDVEKIGSEELTNPPLWCLDTYNPPLSHTLLMHPSAKIHVFCLAADGRAQGCVSCRNSTYANYSNVASIPRQLK
jgi:hypothetical protein